MLLLKNLGAKIFWDQKIVRVKILSNPTKVNVLLSCGCARVLTISFFLQVMQKWFEEKRWYGLGSALLTWMIKEKYSNIEFKKPSCVNKIYYKISYILPQNDNKNSLKTCIWTESQSNLSRTKISEKKLLPYTTQSWRILGA